MEKECAHCGGRFVAKRKSRLYCSDNCKQLAYYKRNGLVLQGNKSQHTPLEGYSIAKDVDLIAAFSKSFITRLNALIEEEVHSRLAQRLGTDVANQNRAVKSYFAESDKNISATNHPVADNLDSDSSREVDVKDDIDTTTESPEPFTETENINNHEPVDLSNDDDRQPEYSKDVDVKSNIDTSAKSVEPFTQMECRHPEPVDFPDDDQPIVNSNEVSVKDDINTTSESIASFTESKAEIESAENNDRSIPANTIDNTPQSPEALNVKHEQEASFTATSENNGEQNLDNDAGFEKALAALDDFTVSDINSSIYRKKERLSSTPTGSFPSQASLDSNQPLNVKGSGIAKDKKEKISSIIASLQGVARKDVFSQPIRESSRQDNPLKPEGAREFKWVHSTFIEQINKHPRRTDIEFLRYKSPDQWKIFVVTKSLLRHLALLTLCPAVTRHAVVELSNGFYIMISSKEFSSLPKSFPYQETIVQLHKQIRSIAEKATSKPAPLRISRAQRAEIFAILTEMKSTVKGVEFGTLKINLG